MLVQCFDGFGHVGLGGGRKHCQNHPSLAPIYQADDMLPLFIGLYIYIYTLRGGYNLNNIGSTWEIQIGSAPKQPNNKQRGHIFDFFEASGWFNHLSEETSTNRGENNQIFETTSLLGTKCIYSKCSFE